VLVLTTYKFFLFEGFKSKFEVLGMSQAYHHQTRDQ